MDAAFIKALQKKMRFAVPGTKGGQLTVEDLFDLTPAQLDALYRALSTQNTTQGEGLIKRHTETTAELAMTVVKTVFEIKTAAAEAAQKRAETRERNQKILAIISEKQDGDLKTKSIDELKKLLDESSES